MFIIIALIVGLIFATSLAYDPRSSEYSPENVRNQREIYQYEVFMRVADNYVDLNPSASGEYTWQQIKSSAPPTLRSMSFPSHYRLRVNSLSNFYVCGKFSSLGAVGIASQTLPSKSILSLGEGKFISSRLPAISESNKSSCS